MHTPSAHSTMLISVAEEMNPTRRNTMEDAHVIHAPQTWSAPCPSASFIGVYDGHGGRLIVDYLEDHLANNVAQEWTFGVTGEKEQGRGGGVTVAANAGRKRRRRADDNDSSTSTDEDSDDEDDENDEEETDDDENEIIHNALERAFLLTDIQSRMAGLTTSGATVVCTIIQPQFDNQGICTEIHIHAANAGDARAVLSSTVAHSALSAVVKQDTIHHHNYNNNNNTTTTAVRITQDHKSTDTSEIQRIEAVGGTMIRDRVMGILAVARSLGDHGLKEFVIAKPFLSSTVVNIVDCDIVRNNNNGNGVKATTSSSSHLYTNGEFLIVACDGLWDVMEDDEAVDAVRDHVAENGMSSRTEVASILVNLALERGSTDNVTVIVYWL